MTTETKPPVIALCPCESSQIAAHGYHPETQTLALQFRSKAGPGSTYTYANFTQDDYDAFVKSDSLGKHFGQFIKRETEKHPWTKLEPVTAETAEASDEQRK